VWCPALYFGPGVYVPPSNCCVIVYVALGQKRFETPALKHRCRRRQILGVQRIFARISPNLPENFCATFGYRFSPTKIMKTFFSMTFKKRSSCIFLQTLGAIFARIFRVFAQIFRDFDRIFDKSILSGVGIHPLHLRLLHHCFKVSGMYTKKRNNIRRSLNVTLSQWFPIFVSQPLRNPKLAVTFSSKVKDDYKKTVH